MREFAFSAGRRTLAIALAVMLCAPALAEPQPASASRPLNMIVICADDLGYADLGAQDAVDDVKTPHLDRLAREGVRCTAAYVTAPQCTPSRAGLLTGRYQQRFGLDSNSDGPLPLAELTIAERLQPAGYTTGMVGKWHLEPNAICRAWAAQHLPDAHADPKGRVVVPQEVARQYYPAAQGFAEYLVGNRHGYWANYGLAGEWSADGGRPFIDRRFRIDVQTEAALAFINRNANRPFFLFLSYFAPHVPLEATPEYLSRFPGAMANRRRHALAMLSGIDDGVDKILALLKQQQLDEHTLIVFTSDNGAPLNRTKEDAPVDQDGPLWNGSLNEPWVGEKGMLTEGGIRVPMIVRYPARLVGGQRYSEPISTLDLAATCLAVAGVPQTPDLDGVDLLPYLSGDNAGSPHGRLYWRFGTQAAVRQGSWKYLTLGDGREYLFDLSSAAHEHKNLTLEHRELADSLRSSLAAWTQELHRPGLATQPPSREEKNWYDYHLPQP